MNMFALSDVTGRKTDYLSIAFNGTAGNGANLLI